MALRRRFLALLVSLFAAAPLVIASQLTTDPSGHGTHEQLGMAPCGWVVALDKPCPTCGMTTAFTAAVHGRILDAFAIQPFAALLALVAAGVFWAGLHVAVLGSSLDRMLLDLLRPSVFVGAGVALVLAWLYKLATWPG